MRHLEPNNFDIRLILKHTSIIILRIKISWRKWGKKNEVLSNILHKHI